MKKIVCILAVIAASFFLHPVLLRADEIGDLKREIEDLKTRLEVVEAEGEDTGERLSKLMEVGGYADVEVVVTGEPGKSNGARIRHMNLHFKKQLSEKWRFFTEVEYEDGPKIADNEPVKGELSIEAFTLKYSPTPRLNLTLGRYLTPFGIWHIDHYSPFVPTQEMPMHIGTIVPHFADGLQLSGIINIGSAVADYTLYGSNGAGNSGGGDGNEEKVLGGRFKLGLPFLARMEVGLSGYMDGKDSSASDAEKKVYGFDLLIQWDAFKFQGEYTTASLNPISGGDYDRKGYYGQIIYSITNAWDLIYRYDWYDPKSTVGDDETTINTLAVNYHFTPYIVGKIEHHFVEPEDTATDNYNITISSIAVYLGD